MVNTNGCRLSYCHRHLRLRLNHKSRARVDTLRHLHLHELTLRVLDLNHCPRSCPLGADDLHRSLRGGGLRLVGGVAHGLRNGRLVRVPAMHVLLPGRCYASPGTMGRQRCL